MTLSFDDEDDYDEGDYDDNDDNDDDDDDDDGNMVDHLLKVWSHFLLLS